MKIEYRNGLLFVNIDIKNFELYRRGFDSEKLGEC